MHGIRILVFVTYQEEKHVPPLLLQYIVQTVLYFILVPASIRIHRLVVET